MTAPRLREQADPPSPPDRRPPRRGGGSSPSTHAASAAGRAAGPVRLSGARRGLVRSARALAAAALLALSGALALPPSAQAQTAIALVSNIGLGVTGFTSVTSRSISQRFDTGDNGNGYTLTGVDLVSDSSDAFAAQVCETDSSGHPTSTCWALDPPGTFVDGTVSFAAPAGTPLTITKETTYAVVVTRSGSGGEVRFTDSDSENPGKAAEWSIADVFDRLNIDLDAYVSHSGGGALQIAIKGTITPTAPLSTDATLSALSLGTGVLDRSGLLILPGTGVVFDQPFASGTYVYTATVGNAENDVQVLATASDGNATIEYLDASDTALSDPNDVDLSVGANNVIKVKVTAEDDTTTLTYTVTVTRVAAVALTPPSDALVSTLGRGTGTEGHFVAVSQAFTTGSNADGYTLTGVDVASASSTGFTVQVCGTDSGVALTSDCTSLTAPVDSGAFPVGAVSFTAPANTVLMKETIYAVVVTATGAANTQGWGHTTGGISAASDDEDAGSAAGWSVANGSRHRLRHQTTLRVSSSRSLRMAVRGSAVEGGTASTDATLSALSVTARLPLMTFVSGTTSYATSVKHDVDEVNVAATTNDSNATFEIQDASDMTLADADTNANGFQVTLAASATVIKVKVTAEDGTTTQTYTVTVTRAVITPVTPPADALVSNVGQSSNSNEYFFEAIAQGFTTGSNASGYTLTGVDVLSASTTGFTAQVCGTDSSGLPTSTCTALTAPGSIAVGTNAFTAPANTTLVKDTTYAVVVTADGATQGWGVTEADGEDAGKADGWSIADTSRYRSAGDTWNAANNSALRVAVRGSAVGGTANNAPVFDPATATREVAENSAAGTNVGAVIPEATDTDTGDTLTYSMEGTDAASFAFDASTRQITTIAGVTYNHEATKNSYSVTVKASDGTASATIAVTIDVTDVNEKSAKPDKPTLAKVTGSSTTLTATWTKPDLNGGPDIAGYDVAYREGTTGSWEDFSYVTSGLTTTITGLTADTSYQARVRTTNDELLSDWSDASDAVKTNAAAVAPTISAVAVTSTPVLETDTYGAGETIEVSVTFDEAVNATSDTDFVLSVAGAKRAPLVRGSGTATLVFGYTVVPGDEDDNGIWIGDQDRTLVGNRDGDPQNGTITSVATSTAADLTHAELGQQSGHKVDGSRSIVSVAVSSTPMLETDTYGAGETIRFTVTFNVAVDVSGDPVLTFALGNQGQVRDVDAAHEGGGGSTALVFAYTVVSTDEDNNGIFLRDEDDFNNPDGPVRLDSDDTIRFAGTSTDVPLYWQGRGTQSGHKVDGSRTTGNTAPSFTSSATFDAAENQTAVGTVVAADSDADDNITDYAITGGADQALFEIGATTGELTFDNAPNFEDPEDSGTDNTYVVTVEATSGTGTREMTATQTITVTVTDADEKSAKPDKPTLAKVTGSSTSLTATWTKPDLDGGPDIAGYDLQYRVGTTGTWEDFAHSDTAVTTTVTGLTADTSYQVQVRAKNGETDSDWSDPSDAVKTNAAAFTCTDNDVHLTGGSETWEGDIYICHQDSSQPVCDDGLSGPNGSDLGAVANGWAFAGVVCRQLGHATGTATTQSSFSGHHLNNFLLDDVVCNGSEANLGACQHPGWGVENCTGSEFAGVRCTVAATGLMATGGDREVALAWDAPGADPGITRHEYRYKTTGGTYPAAWTPVPDSAADETNEASHTVTGLAAGTEYDFELRIVGGANASDADEATARTTGVAAPTNFTATAGDAQVMLSWDAPATGSGVTKHQYRQKTTGSYPATWTDIPNSEEDGANEAGFTVTTNIVNDTAYTFELRAVKDTTNSDAVEDGPVTPMAVTPGTCTLNTGDLWCGVVTVEELVFEGTSFAYGFVDASASPNPSDTGALSNKNFTVTLGTIPYTIDLATVGLGATAEGLNFSLTSALTAADLAKLVLHVDGGSGTFAFSDATRTNDGFTYQWSMTGLDWSSETSVTLRLRLAPEAPGKPTNLMAEADGGTRIALSWDAPADDGGSAITGYRIEVSDDAGSNWEDLVDDTGNDDTTYTHEGLSPGDTRHYRVSAINAEGASVASDVADATTAAAMTCTLYPDDIWCGVVTVERFPASQIDLDGFGSGSDEGDLSDKEFTYGTNSYTIDLAANERNNGALLFSLTSALTAEDRAALRLHVDGNGASFAFSAATYNSSAHTYTWTGTGLDWFGTSTVTLRLRAATETDATLSALTVTRSGGVIVPLRPAFAPGTTRVLRARWRTRWTR